MADITKPALPNPRLFIEEFGRLQGATKKIAETYLNTCSQLFSGEHSRRAHFEALAKTPNPGLFTKKFCYEQGEVKMTAERYLRTLSMSFFTSTKCTAKFRRPFTDPKI